MPSDESDTVCSSDDRTWRVANWPADDQAGDPGDDHDDLQRSGLRVGGIPHLGGDPLGRAQAELVAVRQPVQLVPEVAEVGAVGEGHQ